MKENLTIDELNDLANELRYVIADMICRSGSGHLGGAVSIIEIMITLYYRVMNVKNSEPGWNNRDRLILSKGHAAPVLYAVLAYKKFFPKSWLKTLNCDGTKLPSHADARTVPGIDMTTGSLGQGLSAACGMAFAAKKDKRANHIFCIVGDGELNEGQNWEAAMFASHNRLDNLIAICDYNKLQIDGFTYEVIDLEPLTDKWKSFNWNVIEADGHNWNEIFSSLERAKKLNNGKPTMIIMHTTKAKDCSTIENIASSHNIKIGSITEHQNFLKSITSGEYKLPY
ncbi:transketolase [Lentisphaerota bacterium WC36G]|nr:transketolase [Lentisphaerae bacterium WC36]